MSVKATINGTVWEFSTAAEAVEFQLAMNPAPRMSPSAPVQKRRRRAAGRLTRIGGVVPSTQDTNQASVGELSKETLEVLELVRRFPQEGLTSEQFARVIGSPSTDALPVQMMRIGKELLPLNLKTKDVIARSRKYVKGRGVSVYKPGPKLDEVLRGQDGSLFAAAR